MKLIDVEHFCDCRNSFSECDVCMKAEVCDYINIQPTFNLAEHDKDVIRKFAEWLASICLVWSEDNPFGMSAKTLIYEYEHREERKHLERMKEGGENG